MEGNLILWTQMNADYQDFEYKQLTEKIIRIFYRVYNKLARPTRVAKHCGQGYGFLEKVYEEFKRIAFDNLRKRFSAGIGENLRPNYTSRKFYNSFSGGMEYWEARQGTKLFFNSSSS